MKAVKLVGFAICCTALSTLVIYVVHRKGANPIDGVSVLSAFAISIVVLLLVEFDEWRRRRKRK